MQFDKCDVVSHLHTVTGRNLTGPFFNRPITVALLSDSMLRGIRPLGLSREHYINKHWISGAKIKDISELVKEMNDMTPYKKVLLHIGTNNVLNDDHQTIITEIKYLIELIQAKWPAEVTFSGIILHKTDGRKNIKIDKINDEIKQKSRDWNIRFLDNTNVVTLSTGHIDPEAYHKNLHLSHERGTKKLASNIKFALALKSKTYSPKNSDQTRIKQTDNTSRPHHSAPDTTRPAERDTYAQNCLAQIIRFR